MWLGEQIDKYGIGNGVSLIITAGIVAGMPKAIMEVANGFSIRAADDKPYGVDTVIFLCCRVCGGGRRIDRDYARPASHSYSTGQTYEGSACVWWAAQLFASASQSWRRDANHFCQFFDDISLDGDRIF